MKFAAVSDIHGQYASLSEMIERARNLGAEFLVLAGDLTNAEYAGYSMGMKQIGKISSIIESSGFEAYYVLGNRDRAGGRPVECQLPGDLSLKDVEVDGYVFTNRNEDLDRRSIYVNHHLEPKFRMERAEAYLVLYGHDHVPRIYGNYVDLGYLNDSRGNDAESPRGGFFMIGVDGEAPKIDYVNMGGMVASGCRIHVDQGTFFVPSSWGDACPMCRNDEKYRFYLTE
jgi:predicted phosphodiesterase